MIELLIQFVFSDGHFPALGDHTQRDTRNADLCCLRFWGFKEWERVSASNVSTNQRMKNPSFEMMMQPLLPLPIKHHLYEPDSMKTCLLSDYCIDQLSVTFHVLNMERWIIVVWFNVKRWMKRCLSYIKRTKRSTNHGTTSNILWNF